LNTCLLAVQSWRGRASAAAVAIALALVSRTAGADAGTDAGSDAGTPASCDPATLWCSNGATNQTIASQPGQPLPVGIDTGWMPSCPDKLQHNCGKQLQVRAWLQLAPLQPTQSACSVTMPLTDTKLDARWPTGNGLELTTPVGAPTGTFKVVHGLMASFAFWIDTSIFTGEVSIPGDKLLSLVPGGLFNYFAANQTKLAPWGFAQTQLDVAGGTLSNNQLFAISLADLGKVVNVNNTDEYLEGSFSFNAVTHSTFTYRTTEVLPIGATGSIASQSAGTLYPGPFLGAADFLVKSKGVMRYSGDVEVLPVIHITSIAGFGITLDFPISVGIKFPYDSSDIELEAALADVHIPLPNASLSSTNIAFGPVPSGTQSASHVTIANTGELGLLITGLSSSDPDFVVSMTSTMVSPGALHDVPIVFQPLGPGPRAGTVTIHTNDPDSPSFAVTVGGEGVGPSDAGPDALIDAAEVPLDGSSDSPASADASTTPDASDPGPAACVAGQQVACACPGSGVSGAQVCKDDGSGFGSCQGCPDAGEDADAPADDAGGCGCSQPGTVLRFHGLGALVLGGLFAVARRRRPGRVARCRNGLS